MSLDNQDKQMMSVSVPVVDYWEMKDEINHLENTVTRLEKVVETLVQLYKEERVKNWEIILKEMLKKEELKRGKQYGSNTG
jgi:hypothetical protein